MGCGQISLAGFPRGSPYRLTIIQDRLWLNIAAGCPATAVRFGNRPAPSVGRHLTGQKGLGQPLRTRPLAVFFLQSAGPRRTAIGRLRTAACVLICSHLRRNSLITCTLPQGYDTIILINRFYQLEIILECKIWK